MHGHITHSDTSPRSSVATACSPSEGEGAAGGVLFAAGNMLAAQREGAVSSVGAELRLENESLRAQLLRSQQVVESQQAELAEKTKLIEALQNRLARLSSLAAAVAEEVHGAHSVIAGASAPSHQAPQVEQQQQVVPQQQVQQEEQKPAAAVPRSLNASPEQHDLQHLASMLACLQKPQPVSTAAVPAAAAAEATGAGVGGLAALNSRLQASGTKRSRLWSATGSVGDPFKLHAASGGSGSSSSRQQLSADEGLDEDIDCDEVDCGDATAGCLSSKRQHSPGSNQRAQQQEQLQLAGNHMEADDEDDKSQDDLDAAQCLQQLAMSAGEVQTAAPGVPLPTLFDSLSNSERFAAPKPASAASNLARWGSGGQIAGVGGVAAAGYAGSSSSNGSGSANGATYDALHAQIMNYLQQASGTAAGSSDGLARQQQASTQQQLQLQQQHKKLTTGFMQQQQQQRQLHHFGSGSLGAPAVRRGSDNVGGAWASPAAKPAGAAAGSMAAPARTRKQSWFQTEIAEKIPLSVQQACAQDWAKQQCMQVVCADLSGTFYINSGGEYLIKLAHSGEVVTPNKFEELAGKKTARNWQQSIRLVGYTMNGELNSALLKLGHFTRIVGLVQDR